MGSKFTGADGRVNPGRRPVAGRCADHRSAFLHGAYLLRSAFHPLGSLSLGIARPGYPPVANALPDGQPDSLGSGLHCSNGPQGHSAHAGGAE